MRSLSTYRQLALPTHTTVACPVFRTINLALAFVRVAKAGPLAIEAHIIARTRHIKRAEFRREDIAIVAEASAQRIVQVLSASP